MPVTSTKWVPNLAAQVTSLNTMGVKNTTRVTLQVLNRGRVLCPVRTGNLRNSHMMKVTAQPGRRHVTGSVFTHVKYARAVHNGRRARVIRPRKKKALAFNWKGRRWVLAKVTQGPVKGNPWLRRALEEVAVPAGYKMTHDPRYTYPAGSL